VVKEKFEKNNLYMEDGQKVLILTQALNIQINKNHYHLKNSILLEKQRMNSEDVVISNEFSHPWNTIITNNSSFKVRDL
tara:strand:- start:225 stop:461 length:237 start_codon:yes stop_codon:yes gene_type:complete